MSRAARSPDSMAPSMPRAVRGEMLAAEPDRAVRATHLRREPVDLARPEPGPAPPGEPVPAPGLEARELELPSRRGPDRLDGSKDQPPRLGLREGVQPARVPPHRPCGEARDLVRVLAVAGRGEHARGPVREHAWPVGVLLPEAGAVREGRPGSRAGISRRRTASACRPVNGGSTAMRRSTPKGREQTTWGAA